MISARHAGRRDWGIAGALAFGVSLWQLWLHSFALEGHSDTALGHLAHWLRDGALLVIPAYLAVRLGKAAARRRRGAARSSIAAEPGWVALAFFVILVPLVGLHGVLDDLFGTGDPFAELAPAPGAGYLLLGTDVHQSAGLIGNLTHGLRDAALSIPVAFMIGLAAALIATRREAVPTPIVDDMVPSSMSKREFLKYGGAGAVAVTLGSGALISASGRRAHAEEQVRATPWLTDDIELFMNDGINKMIDGVPVYSWGWGLTSGPVDEADALHVPGPVLWTYGDERVRLGVTNNLAEPHNFEIEGVVDSGPIAPGQRVEVEFDAPSPGTYIYGDNSNGLVNRVLGLHGVLIVMPADRSMRVHPALDPEHWTFVSQWVWVFNEIDPRFNARAQAGLPIDPVQFIEEFTPRYFTVNGRMGSVAAHSETAPDTVVKDVQGNSALIRVVNVGAATHAPHWHGNHIYPLVLDAEPMSPIMWKDTVNVRPGDRYDVYLPYNIPPNAVHFPPPQSGRDLLKELHGKDIEGTWPMHCHIEMSQSAGGGLYPQGMLTDWKMEEL